MKDNLPEKFLTEVFTRLAVESAKDTKKDSFDFNRVFLQAYFTYLKNPDINKFYFENPSFLTQKDSVDDIFKFFKSFSSQEELSLSMIKHIGGMF